MACSPMGSTGLFPWFGREERKKFIGWCAELSGGGAQFTPG